MLEWIEWLRSHFRDEWRVVKNVPSSFAAAVLAVSFIVGWALSWRYGAIIEIQDARIQQLESAAAPQRSIKPRSPSEPWRLNEEQKEFVGSVLGPPPSSGCGAIINCDTQNPEACDYAADLKAALHSRGWNPSIKREERITERGILILANLDDAWGLRLHWALWQIGDFPHIRDALRNPAPGNCVLYVSVGQRP